MRIPQPRHNVTFLSEPTDRAEGHELAILVDGVNLRDLVRAAELPFATAEGHREIAGAYAGLYWPRRYGADVVLQHFLGSPDSAFLYDGRTQILGCECGDPGCWPLVCHIDAGPDTVRWREFLQPHRSGPKPWKYDSLGPFVFERAQYERALLAAMSGGAT